MNGGAPLSLLKKQINDEYYKNGMTLEQVFCKYHRYDRTDIERVLGLYDLSSEPRQINFGDRVFGKTFGRKWEAECRRLNPKAWEGR